MVAFGRSIDIIQDELLRKIYGSYISLDHGDRGTSIVFNLDSYKN